MRELTYLAIFEPNGTGGYGVYFPDLSGCISVGNDYKHAMKMAEEALSLHVYGMEEDGDEIPFPTSNPNDLEVGEGTEGRYLISPVTIYPDITKNQMDNRAVKTNTTLPAWLKLEAERAGINFSQLLQVAIKKQLNL